MSEPNNFKAYLDKPVLLILSLSGVVCGFLIWLIYFREGVPDYREWVNLLPATNALLNASCAVCLLGGWWSIKQSRADRHKRFMLTAVFFSALFLISYMTYHYFHGDTRFLSQGAVRVAYFFILISHICFSIIALPMVFTTLYHALRGSFDSHRSVAKYTFPIWLYVSITGVLVFVLLKFYA